eukprot:1938191-Pleurochrysis_carterae.AAC.1
MAPLEVSWVQTANGQERLYVNLLDALRDEAGDLHLPKDDSRRELALTQAQVSDLRRQILADAKLMEELNFPLSAA